MHRSNVFEFRLSMSITARPKNRTGELKSELLEMCMLWLHAEMRNAACRILTSLLSLWGVGRVSIYNSTLSKEGPLIL